MTVSSALTIQIITFLIVKPDTVKLPNLMQSEGKKIHPIFKFFGQIFSDSVQPKRT